MWELIQANWLAFLIVAILAILIALWIAGRARKPRERSHRPDVLDEGVGPARRNQALIDAPPASVPPSVARDMASEPVRSPEPRTVDAQANQPPATPPLGGSGVAVAAAVLSSEPGTDEEVATDHHKTHPDPKASDAPVSAPTAPAAPASETRSDAASAGDKEADGDDTFAPNDQAISDREAVAAAVKVHEGASATDDLSKIKGVGPKLIGMLGSMGISRYDQIAAWSDDDVQKIDAQMGDFAGRIDRDNWREQARLLSQDDREAYEGKFGKL